MPTYEYVCTDCANEWEEIQKISEPALEVCPKCGKTTAKRQISGGSFILKGGGWYADLYSSSPKKSGGDAASPSKSSPSGAPAAPAAPSKSDSGGSSGGSSGSGPSGGSGSSGSSGGSGSSGSSGSGSGGSGSGGSGGSGSGSSTPK